MAEFKMLSDEDNVIAQQEYIKHTYNQVKVILDFPLRGWRREECLLQAQLKYTLSQVVEMVEGMENSYPASGDKLGWDITTEYKAEGFDKAIQTIGEKLKEANNN